MSQYNNKTFILYNLQPLWHHLVSYQKHLHMVQSTHRCIQCQMLVSHYLCSHILNYPGVAGSARQQLFANALENDLDWSCASTPRLLKNQERRSTRSSGEFCSTKLICSQISQRGSADSRPPQQMLHWPPLQCLLHITLSPLPRGLLWPGAGFTKIDWLTCNSDFRLICCINLS